MDRTFKNVSDTECFADLTEVTLDAVFVLHHRSAADDFEVGHFREVGQDLVLNTIGEVGILFVIAQIGERQNGNAFFRNRRRETEDRSSRSPSVKGRTK